jgi:5-methylcytosine-specific restriction protein A
MGVAGRAVYSSKRWDRARFLAKRRDQFRCVQCVSRDGLEVHHKQRVRERPDIAYELTNLVTLCRRCHSNETDKELGRVPNAARDAWKVCVRELSNDKPERTR